MATAEEQFSAEETRLIRKAAVRVVPFLMFCYFVSFVDRINIGFASYQMNSALHISPGAFGLGGGLYFISYFLFEVPSNLAQERLGARIWLARIMIVWGLIAAGMAAIQGPRSFWTMRFLLGAAEAGCFPGVILYLTEWFPRAFRARFIGWFAVAIPLSGFLGSPISAVLLKMGPIWGLAGWQWLFLMEGAPAVLLGVVCLVLLPDRPADARWLSDGERAVYEAMLRRDGAPAKVAPASFLANLKYVFRPLPLLLSLALVGTTAVSSAYAIWTPRIIKSFHWSTMAAGWLSALPFLLGAVAMVAVGLLSDRGGERIRHAALPLFLAGAATAAMLFTSGFLGLYLLMSLSIVGIYACKGPAWAAVTEWLPVGNRAAGIAQVNAVSNLAGFATVYAVGLIRQGGGSFALALLPLAALSVLSGWVIHALGRRKAGRMAGEGVLLSKRI